MLDVSDRNKGEAIYWGWRSKQLINHPESKFIIVELTNGVHADRKFKVKYPNPNVDYNTLNTAVRLRIAEEGFRISVGKLMRTMEAKYDLTIKHNHYFEVPPSVYLYDSGYRVTLTFEKNGIKHTLYVHDDNLRQVYDDIETLLHRGVAH